MCDSSIIHKLSCARLIQVLPSVSLHALRGCRPCGKGYRFTYYSTENKLTLCYSVNY